MNCCIKICLFSGQPTPHQSLVLYSNKPQTDPPQIMWCFLQHCALFWCLVFLHRWVECLLNTWSNQKLLVVPLPPILEVLCEGPSCQEVWGGFGTLLVHFLPQNLEGCHRLQSQKTSNYKSMRLACAGTILSCVLTAASSHICRQIHLNLPMLLVE